MGRTSSGILIVLFAMYISYVRRTQLSIVAQHPSETTTVPFELQKQLISYMPPVLPGTYGTLRAPLTNRHPCTISCSKLTQFANFVNFIAVIQHRFTLSTPSGDTCKVDTERPDSQPRRTRSCGDRIATNSATAGWERP